MEQRTKGTLLALSGMALMSLDAVFVRLSGLSGFNSSFLFGFFSFISMTIFTIATSKEPFRDTLKNGGGILILSGMIMGGSGTTFVLAVTHTTVANVVLIMSSTPLFSALFSHILLKESTDSRTWAAIFVTLTGIFIIVHGSVSMGGIEGDLLSVACTAFSSLNYVVWRKYPHISRSMAVGFGGFFIALFSSFGTDFGNFSLYGVIVMAVMGLMSAPFGRTLVSTSARHIKAAEISLYTLMRTILAPVMIWAVFAEIPPKDTFVGGSVMLSAVLWHIFSKRR